MKSKLVYALFEKQVSLRPDAVVLEKQYVTYEKLNEKVNCLANFLKAIGVGADKLVAVYLDYSVELLVSMLALLKVGGGYVPINPESPAKFNGNIVVDTGVKYLITSKRFVNRLNFVDNDVVQVVLEDLPESSGLSKFTPLVLSKDNVAAIVYTSGSTGEQKGIVLSQENIYELVSSMQKVHKFSEEDIWGCRHATTFIMSMLESCCAILFGGKAIILKDSVKQSYDEYVDFLIRNAVTCIALIPFELYEIIGIGRPKIQKTFLRLIIMGGGALDRKRALEFVKANPKTVVVDAYGLSEVSGPMTNGIVALGESGGIGAVVANCFTKILDDNFSVPSNAAGEICIGGARLARGYLNRPDLTAEKFIANPFGDGDRLYRTGDLGRYLPDGNIEFLGRIDNQVKIRGFRIELGEIEAAINNCKGVKTSVVLAKEDSEKNKQLVAYVVPKTLVGDEKGLIEDIRNDISQKLPEYMIPGYFLVLEEIPLTPNGKTDNKLLLRMDTGKRTATDEYVVPRNEIERRLCEIWQGVLHLNKVGINDNFFKIGGHSLLATRLISKVRSEFNAEVPLKSLFEHPTIAALSIDVKNGRLNEKVPPLVAQEKPTKIPLSFAQQRLWIIDKLLPEKALYNIPCAMKLLGNLDYSKLEAAIGKLIKRHESFRTNFCETQEGAAYQIIEPAWDFKLEVEEVLEAEVEAKAKEEAERPFDLSKDHLLRVKLLKVRGDKHVLLITMHHIISDGWSMPIFLDELAKLYNGEEELSELPITYADYAIWQRSWLRDEALDKQLSYWKEYLADIPEQIDLPYEHQRPVEMTYVGGRVSSKIGHEVYEHLKELARDTNTTMFMVIFAAVSCVLHRYTRQEDVVIGTPIANRHYRETEGLIGFFVNTLALRTHFQDGITFREILEDVKKSVLEGYENQDVPFEYLVDKLNVEKRLNVNPLFQVMVTVVKEEEDREFKGLEVNDLTGEYAISKFDLEVEVQERKEDMEMSITYSEELFGRETVEKLGIHLVNLIEAIVENPGVEVDRVEFLTEEEKRQQLVDWNSTAVDYPKDKCIHELFEEQVKKSPEAIAVVFEEKHLTYGELNEKSNQLARYLREQGVEADDLVGICVERSLEMIIGILGVLKAGEAYVPLDPSYPKDRLDYMKSDSGVKIVIDAEYLRNEAIWHGSKENLTKITSPQNLAYVIYTSGSTGKPKGVQISHNGLVNRIVWMQAQYNLKSDDRILQKTPMSFDVSMWEFLWAISCGAQLVILEPDAHKDPIRLWNVIRKQRISTVHFVPSMLENYVKMGKSIEEIKNLIASGEALGTDLFCLCRRKVNNLYGPTEASIDVSFYSDFDAEIFGPSVPIGRPISNTQLYILDKDQQLVSRGVAGEICIGGVGLARGYLNRPDLTAEKFIANPFGDGDRLYRTGDLGRYLPDGNIEFLGRIDNQVKIRGFRIELGEIEAAINNCKGVKTSVVLAKEDSEKNKQLVAYVVPKTLGGDEKGLIEDIRNGISQKLPEYMIPSYFVVLEKIPLTPNGKTDNKLLLKMDTGKRTAINEHVAPRNSIEKGLCEIWQEVLHLNKVGINDNFFKMGGHSLLATRLIMAINSNFETNLRLVDIFRKNTIAEIASELVVPKCSSVIIPLSDVSSNKKKLFMIHPGTAGCEVYVNLAKVLGKQYCCYGIDSYNLYNKNRKTNIYELACYYLSKIESIVDVHDTKTYEFLGWSLGGQIAMEMAAILEEKGIKGVTIILLDTMIFDENLCSFHLTHEQLIDEFKNFSPDMQDTLISLYELEETMRLDNLHCPLKFAKLFLFKAEKSYDAADYQKQIEYGVSLPYNNIDKLVIDVSNIRVIRMFDADHLNIVQKIEERVKKLGGLYLEENVNFNESFPLLPIQRWYFDQRLINVNGFSQDALFKINETTSLSIWESVFRAIISYHEAFRIRFKNKDNQYFEYVSEDFSVNVIEKRLSEDGIFADIEGQRKLNIEKGPLLNVVVYRGDKNDFLYVNIHHLVVDGVSWHILVDSINAMYRAFSKSGRISLHRNCATYQQWASKLETYLGRQNICEEIDFWNAMETCEGVDSDFDLRKEETNFTNKFSTTLEQKRTERLLYNVCPSCSATVNDILLTALILSFGDLTGKYEQLITLEGHGREAIVGLNVSKTIGWFTSVFPCFFKISNSSDILGSINEVKKSLQNIPNKGIGFGILKLYTDCISVKLPRICFNYLGKWNTHTAGSIIDYLSMPKDVISQGETPFNNLEINAYIEDDEFKAIFSAINSHSLGKLAEGFMDRLNAIISFFEKGEA